MEVALAARRVPHPQPLGCTRLPSIPHPRALISKWGRHRVPFVGVTLIECGTRWTDGQDPPKRDPESKTGLSFSRGSFQAGLIGDQGGLGLSRGGQVFLSRSLDSYSVTLPFLLCSCGSLLPWTLGQRPHILELLGLKDLK